MKCPELIDTLAACSEDCTLFVAFELGKAKWRLGIVSPGGGKLSQYSVAGGDVAAVLDRIERAQAKAEKRLGKPVRVVSCYEAGYDGFWLHHWLQDRGIVNRVLDPSSVEVNRRARRAKTDRLDLEKLMRALMRLEQGDRLACKPVQVPTPEQEDARRPWRERDRLMKERTGHINRLKGLLHGQGIRTLWKPRQDFGVWLSGLITGDGRALPPGLVAELKREYARLLMVQEQIAELEAQAEAEREAPADKVAAGITQLIELKSLGPTSSHILMREVFFRDFKNRRQVGSYFGLTGTPYDSGASRHEQGISKAGNARARRVAVQLAWLWLRNQPGSALSCWFRKRVGAQTGAVKRIAITALARKLMVALWRFLHDGVLPHGAALRAT